MKKHTSLKSKFNSAFSLVELLVVIAVIAIIAAIAIPNIAGITGAADIAKHQRNAQSIAAMFNNARAAGYAGDIADREAAADAVVAGIPVGTMTFRVDGVTGVDLTTAKTYLEYDGNLLRNVSAPTGI